VRALRGLLRGEQVVWDGKPIRMLQVAGATPPIDVPFVIAAGGPKGVAVARELGDGVFGAVAPVAGFEWSIVLTFGTVLDEGEDAGSDRVVAAAGHAASVVMHYAAEHGLLDAMLPDLGRRWLAAYDDVPDDARHLAMHRGHLVLVNEHDRPFVDGPLLRNFGLALSRAGWRERLVELEAAGATEVAYQPAGPDVARELAAFADAARR